MSASLKMETEILFLPLLILLSLKVNIMKTDTLIMVVKLTQNI